MTTKSKILESAVKLFNEYGTAKISTNHIAKEAGISPGNLYYHYKDKAHIIREVYDLMIREWDVPFTHMEEGVITPELIRQFIKENFALLWKYRFFSREAVALLNADNVLAGRHFLNTQYRIDQHRKMLQQAVRSGVLKFPDSHKTLEDILNVAWIVSNNYLIYLETLGQTVTRKDFNSGAELIMTVMSPYLSKGVKKHEHTK